MLAALCIHLYIHLSFTLPECNLRWTIQIARASLFVRTPSSYQVYCLSSTRNWRMTEKCSEKNFYPRRNILVMVSDGERTSGNSDYLYSFLITFRGESQKSKWKTQRHHNKTFRNMWSLRQTSPKWEISIFFIQNHLFKLQLYHVKTKSTFSDYSNKNTNSSIKDSVSALSHLISANIW